MKWQDDDYADLKWEIFDLVRKNLFATDAYRISIKSLTDQIDLLFENIKNIDDRK